MAKSTTALPAAEAAAALAPAASASSSSTVTASIWNKTIAAEGDLAILWRGHKDVSYAHLTPGGSFHHAVGRFNHNDIIGKPYGTRLEATVAQKHGRSQQVRQCLLDAAVPPVVPAFGSALRLANARSRVAAAESRSKPVRPHACRGSSSPQRQAAALVLPSLVM